MTEILNGEYELISIHAPREGSDAVDVLALLEKADISIHAPREGSDAVRYHVHRLRAGFLSTLPARGATCRSSHWGPRSSMISIHAPREGSDQGWTGPHWPGR